MPSADDLANFKRLQQSGSDRTLQIIPPFPQHTHPPDVLKRFPSLVAHDKERDLKVEQWRVKANIAILGGVS